MKGRKKRVVLGISGSRSGKVAAALLKNQDFEVKCVYLELKNPFGQTKPYFFKPETEAGEIEKFCRKLDIDLLTIDITEEFEAKVIDPAILARLSGASADSHLLWVSDVLLKNLEHVRKEIKADFLATGHRIQMTAEAGSERATIYLGHDWQKDECPLIARADPETLRHVFFPIGEIPPMMVRKLSQELGLEDKTDTDEKNLPSAPSLFQWDLIPPSVWSSEWLENRLPANFLATGPIRSADQMGLGEHEGLHRFRIGDRSPIDPASRVTDLQIKSSAHIVITGPPSELARTNFFLEQTRFTIEMNGLREEPLTLITGPVTQKVDARVMRYAGGFLSVECDTPLQSVAPGQTALFFKGNQWVGSALFTSAKPKKRPSGAA